EGFVDIAIEDTGTGVPAKHQKRIFDPFFTTKEVGKGTGQGLAIAYDVIVNKHGGDIQFHTEENVGTTFVIRLPYAEGDAI
ncbi:MAG: two-component system, NtrC family, sensor kinase, partial [Desulfovibrionales bacterium]|nr:two-component system, NtrC family, sensor kinase [Desulfovibrionales bacterium]